MAGPKKTSKKDAAAAVEPEQATSTDDVYTADRLDGLAAKLRGDASELEGYARQMRDGKMPEVKVGGAMMRQSYVWVIKFIKAVGSVVNQDVAKRLSDYRNDLLRPISWRDDPKILYFFGHVCPRLFNGYASGI